MGRSASAGADRAMTTGHAIFGAAPATPSEEELRVARRNNMNVEEGHLGGYIRASEEPAPSGLRVEHGDPATFTPSLFRFCVESLGVESVLDVCCGEGHAAAFFRDLGCRVTGIDGSRQAARDSVIASDHVVHDFVDGAWSGGDAYDLVWCCEFVEHVEPRYSSSFLETFCLSRRYLLMTHARPGQPGWHHVNCQPADYWIARIERLGFRFDEALTARTRDAAESGHFQRSGLAFVRRVTSSPGKAGGIQVTRSKRD